MNIIVPMAGRGSRFADVGFSIPKPLIPVRGRPMYTWAIDSLPTRLAKRLIFVCLAEHLSQRALARDIDERYRSFNPVVLALSEVTQGQACTVLTARDLVDTSEPLVIFNADTYVRSDFEQRLRTLEADVAGILGVFRAAGDKWSFAKTDASGRVVETAEKRRISEWASTGLYYFARGCDFVRHADAMIAAEERVNGEFYVAPVYNRLIGSGMRVEIDVAREVWALGTPEDLARFEADYPRA